MPLGNIDALYEWAVRDYPEGSLCVTVTFWIATELNTRGWAAPSVPMLPHEGEPTEIRIVVIPGTTVTVVYVHDHESERVDLLWVGAGQEITG